MNLPDIINAAFEGGAGLISTANIRALWRAKRIVGIHWAPTGLFTAWGCWNLYYYPHLGQWLSFAGGLSIVSVNTVWLALVWKYRGASALEPIRVKGLVSALEKIDRIVTNDADWPADDIIEIIDAALAPHRQAAG